MKSNPTAILIFAQSGAAEKANKSFFKSSELFDVLNQETIKKVEASDIPYFLISENEQIGTSFGERFTNALEHLFNLGFENVITIGNDTPFLKTKQLQLTAQKLQENKTVLGPSVDGGFYLMGLHKSQFNKSAFLKLPWQSYQLFKRITALLTKKKQVHFLSHLVDIDTFADVKTISKTFKNISKKLRKLIISILSINIGLTPLKSSRIIVITIYAHFNKGSPTLLHC